MSHALFVVLRAPCALARSAASALFRSRAPPKPRFFPATTGLCHVTRAGCRAVRFGCACRRLLRRRGSNHAMVEPPTEPALFNAPRWPCVAAVTFTSIPCGAAKPVMSRRKVASERSARLRLQPWIGKSAIAAAARPGFAGFGIPTLPRIALVAARNAPLHSVRRLVPCMASRDTPRQETKHEWSSIPACPRRSRRSGVKRDSVRLHRPPMAAGLSPGEWAGVAPRPISTTQRRISLSFSTSSMITFRRFAASTRSARPIAISASSAASEIAPIGCAMRWARSPRITDRLSPLELSSRPPGDVTWRRPRGNRRTRNPKAVPT